MLRILRALKKLVPAGRRSAFKRFYGRATWIFYAGNRHECPCCRGRFRAMRAFRPVEGRDYVGIRRNAECPRCGSLERHRLLWLYFQQRTPLFTDRLKVLNIAPEELFQKVFLTLPNLDYLSADLDSPLAMEKMDITRIPRPDDSFEAILCNHVLEHIPDDRKAMRELHRVLRPGGWAILQTPVDEERERTFEDPAVESPEERARLFGQSDHVRIYGRDYVERLRDAGFTVRVIDFRGELGAEQAERYCLDYVDAVYLCAKEPAPISPDRGDP